MAFLLHIICMTATFLPANLGYTFLFGRGKILNFGLVGVGLLSAYSTFLTLTILLDAGYGTGISFAVAGSVGIVAALFASICYAWLSFRLDADGLGILTIAVHLTILNVVLNWQSLTRGALGLPNIPRLPFMQTQEQFTFWITIVALTWVAFFLWLDRTALARQLSALAENEWHGKSLGINRIRVHMIAFLILGLTLASDNFFYAQYLRLLYPTDYNFPSFITVLMMVVAGKPGSVRGAVVATIGLTVLKESIRFLPLPTDILGPLRLLIFGVILLAAIWVQRDTLFPKKRTI